MAEEKPKEWEQPWTPTKIRQQASDWNLAGDAGLLLYLRQASSDLMNRFENTKKHMGDLVDESQKTVVRLDNTINDFSRLANNQFIENRVYDDDAKPNRDSKPKQEVPKTKEEREAEVVFVMKSALETGCAVLDSHFTKIDVRPLDFDEDDDPGFSPQPVFEPKDPYTSRPLPYVIATINFMNSEFIGLREDEDLEVSKKEAISEESSEEDEEVTTPTPARQQQQAGVPAGPAVSAARAIHGAVSPSGEEKAASDSSGLFGTSADSRENAFPTAAAAASQRGDDVDASGPPPRTLESDFRSELTRKLAGAAAATPTTVSTEKPKPTISPSVPPASKSSNNGDDDLLFSPPPLLPRQKKYDDSDDEGGLFKPRTRGLFDDDEDEEESKPPPLPRGRLQKLADSAVAPKVEPPPQPQPQPKLAPARDSSKSSTSTVSIGPAAPSQPSTSASRLVDTTKSKGSSMFADDDDEGDEDDLFGKAYKKESSVPRQIPTSSAKPPIDESVKKPAPVITRPTLSSSALGAAASLFGDDDDDDDDLFTVLKRPKQQAPSKSQGLFGEEPPKKPPTSSEAITSTVSATKNVQEGKPAGEPEPTLAPTSTPANPIKPESKVASDLFSRSPSPPPPTVSTAPSKKESDQVQRPSKGSGLFGEDSDDDDDDALFPAGSATGGDHEKKETKDDSGTKKTDFRAELAKKLLAGPQSGGLVKAPTYNSDNDRKEQESDRDQSSPERPVAKTIDITNTDDDDLFKPPAHGLFGHESSDDKFQFDDFGPKLNFDSEKAVETLPTLQKNRAKLPNRRPPSKHAPSSNKQNGYDSPVAKKSPSPVREVPRTADAVDSRNTLDADPLGVGAGSSITPPVETPPVVTKAEPPPKMDQQKPEEKPAPKTKAAALFEDDDEEDLFAAVDKKGSKARPAANEVKVQEPKKPVAVAPSTQKVPTVPVSATKTATKSGGGGGLFSDEDDDDLFSDTKRNAIKKPVQSAVAADTDIFDTKKKTEPPQQKAASSAMSKSEKKGKSLFDDDDDDVDIFR